MRQTPRVCPTEPGDYHWSFRRVSSGRIKRFGDVTTNVSGGAWVFANSAVLRGIKVHDLLSF